MHNWKLNDIRILGPHPSELIQQPLEHQYLPVSVLTSEETVVNNCKIQILFWTKIWKCLLNLYVFSMASQSSTVSAVPQSTNVLPSGSKCPLFCWDEWGPVTPLHRTYTGICRSNWFWNSFGLYPTFLGTEYGWFCMVYGVAFLAFPNASIGFSFNCPLRQLSLFYLFSGFQKFVPVSPFPLSLSLWFIL